VVPNSAVATNKIFNFSLF